MEITKEDLKLTVASIFNSDYQELEEDNFTDDKTLLLANISGIDINASFTNGDPYIHYDATYDEYCLWFGGDEAPKMIDLNENITLLEVIKLAEEKLLEYQLNFIDNFFEILEDEKEDFGDEWYEGVRIKIHSNGNYFYYYCELTSDLPQVLSDKIQNYMTKLEINNFEIIGKFIYIN